MKEANQKFFGICLAAFSVFIWGITFVSTRYLLNDFSSLEILFYRFITAYIGLWIIHPKLEKIERKDNLLFALAALSGVILYQLSENIAIYFTNASNVSVIVSICPLFTAILSQLFFKEKHLTLCFISGFIIAIVGVALVCFNGNTTMKFNPKGDLLALLAGLCWGFYSLLVSLINKRNYDPLCSTRRIFFFAVLIMLPLSLMGFGINSQLKPISEQAVQAAENLTANDSAFLSSLSFTIDKAVNAERFRNPLNWINIIFLGLFASGLCFTMWNKACNILGTVKVSCAIYLIPVVTTIFAFFVMDEKITLLGAIGTVITIIGLFISEKKIKPN